MRTRLTTTTLRLERVGGRGCEVRLGGIWGMGEWGGAVAVIYTNAHHHPDRFYWAEVEMQQ